MITYCYCPYIGAFPPLSQKSICTFKLVGSGFEFAV